MRFSKKRVNLLELSYKSLGIFKTFYRTNQKYIDYHRILLPYNSKYTRFKSLSVGKD